VYDSLTCSTSIPLNCTGKTWEMDINGHEKSWKMHTKRSWEVMENHFHYSVRTLILVYTDVCCFTQYLWNDYALLSSFGIETVRIFV